MRTANRLKRVTPRLISALTLLAGVLALIALPFALKAGEADGFVVEGASDASCKSPFRACIDSLTSKGARLPALPL